MNGLNDMLPTRISRALGAGLLPLIAGGVLAGCFPLGSGTLLDGPPEPDPEPGPEPGFCVELIGLEADPCKRNIDCAAGAFCDKPAGAAIDDWGCCHPAICIDDDDCAFDQVCQPDVGLCIDTQRCGVDDTAGGAPCAEGEQCVWQSGTAFCSTPMPSDCEIAPGALVTAAAAPVSFGVLWLDAQGQPMAAPVAFEASSDVGAAAAGDLVGSCEGTDVCRGTLTLTAGEASCQAAVTVLPDDPDATRLVVIDAATGAPLAARVHVVDSGGVGTTVDTTDGIVTLASDDLRSATALAPGYRTLSVLSVPAGDLVLPLAQVPDGVAGIRGQIAFNNLGPIVGDVAFGIAGLSIGTPGVDLTLERLFGIDGVYLIPELADISAAGDPLTRQIPSAVTLILGINAWKGPLLAIGEPGERVVWSLATKKRLADMQSFFEISSATWSQVAALEMLSEVSSTVSGVSGSLAVDASPAPMPGGDGVLNYDHHEAAVVLGEGAVGLSPTQLPYWRVQLASPDLPCVGGGACGERALAVVGATLPGRGFVPLGLSAREATEQPSGGTDLVLAEGGPPAQPGIVKVTVAPPHAGLEGQPLSAWLLVFGDRLQDSGDGRPLAFMQWPVVETDVLQQAPAATFGPAVSVSGGDAITLSTIGGAPDVTRHHATLDGEPWEVIVAGAPEDTIELTALLPDDVTGVIGHAHTQALTLQPGVELSALVAAGGDHLGDLDRWVAASRSDR
jgi:hypothetical protein